MRGRIRTVAPLLRLSGLWHWELWLAVALAAFLRLWHLDTTQFLFDQAELMTLARGGIVRGALPITGIPYSVGALSPPFSVYILMPFVAVNKDPMLAVVAIAVWNVLGVALCYVFAMTYFGRRAATTAALLFATCGKTIVFSRYIWQTNCLPPLLILWAFMLYAGAVRGKRGWFVPSIMLLTMIALLHPVGVVLGAVLLVALLLAPHRPRPWEYALGTGFILVLLAPTFVWEVVSGGADYRLLRGVVSHRATLDLQVLHFVVQMLDAPTFRHLNPGSANPFPILLPSAPYAALGPISPLMTVAIIMLYGLSFFVLTGLVVTPIRGVWPSVGAFNTRWARARAGLAAVWRGLRTNASWRANLLLWLWVVVPPLALLRHSVVISPHYLIVLYPGVFLMAGIAIDWFLRHGAVLLSTLAPNATWLRAGLTRLIGRWVVVAFVGLLVVAQAAQSALYIASLASGQIDNTYYGYPLGEVEAADRALDVLQRQEHAQTTLISDPIWYYRQALEYMLVSERPDRVGFFGNCLLLPAPGTGTSLVVSTSSLNLAAALLPALPGARRIATLPMPGSEPFSVYRVPGAPLTLAGEMPVTPALFHDAAGNGLRLDAAALVAPGAMVLRWTVLATTPVGQPQPAYRVRLRAIDASGQQVAFLGDARCESTHWQAGQQVLTWTTLPAGSAPWTQRTAQGSVPQATWAIDVLSATSFLVEPRIGPLQLLSWQVVSTPLTPLQPTRALTNGALPGPGALSSTGEYVISVGTNDRLVELPPGP